MPPRSDRLNPIPERGEPGRAPWKLSCPRFCPLSASPSRRGSRDAYKDGDRTVGSPRRFAERVARIYLNDAKVQDAINRRSPGLAQFARGHHNHAHVEIKPYTERELANGAVA